MILVCFLAVGFYYVHVSELQSRCGRIFRKLMEVSCPLDELRALSIKSNSFGMKFKGFPSTKTEGGLSNWSLRVQDVLSMDILLNSAIDTGSHAPDCWKHVIR